MTWHATIDVDSDVHEVVAHPVYANIVIAAAAIGLCISRDSGATWAVETEGLHAPYCNAVAFSGDDILASASEHHFATAGAVYRRPISGHGPLVPVSGGLPVWLDGIVDTACISTRAETHAVADAGGNLHVSSNAGDTWTRRATGLSAPSSVLIV